MTGSLGTMEALEAEIAAQSQVSFDTNQFKVKSNSGSEPKSQKKRGPLDSYEEFYSSEGGDILGKEYDEEDDHLKAVSESDDDLEDY